MHNDSTVQRPEYSTRDMRSIGGGKDDKKMFIFGALAESR
jgi:hypothetical protein